VNSFLGVRVSEGTHTLSNEKRERYYCALRINRKIPVPNPRQSAATVQTNARLRLRPLQVGALRSFVAVASSKSFRQAADHLALTQSAVSRQIQALENELGVPLFLRSTRSVELTSAAHELLPVVQRALDAIDGTVQRMRLQGLRRTVSVTTFASFASLWLIPKLEAFQAAHPDIDIRVDNSDITIDLDRSEIDFALRYGPKSLGQGSAVELFTEEVMPVMSPWLLKKRQRAGIKPEDLRDFTLIDTTLGANPSDEWLSWRHWLGMQRLAHLQPKRWIRMDYTYQMVQSCLAGQGIALARTPLVAPYLANGELIEAMPGRRIASPWSYWLVARANALQRTEAVAFQHWLVEQAEGTRKQMRGSAA
jgi:DNA-binding transcriptional LysR family regulator